MDFTLLQFLSGAIAERLDISPTDLLSALNALSSLPAHPYEQAKYELFGPEHKFATFQEIEAPKSFSFETAKQQLSASVRQHEETSQAMLSAYGVQNAEGALNYKETEILDKDMSRKSIVFSEAIRTLTLEEINTDPEGVAKKVLSYYLKL